MVSTVVRPWLRVLGIAGSLRRGSDNRGLIRAAAELAPDGIEVVPLEMDLIPLYNAGLEAHGDPKSVERLKQAIAEADALLVATPEYNRGIPSPLKNAIDWASRPPGSAVLKDKPIAIVGASPGQGGTARAQAQLRETFAFIGSAVLPSPEVLIPRATSKFDADGNLTDLVARLQIREMVRALAMWTTRTRGRDHNLGASCPGDASTRAGGIEHDRTSSPRGRQRSGDAAGELLRA